MKKKSDYVHIKLTAVRPDGSLTLLIERRSEFLMGSAEQTAQTCPSLSIATQL